MDADRREVMCPSCGGKLEERGQVRFYGTGNAYVNLDGTVEWVADTWTTPVETLELDEDPYCCLSCDAEWALEDLKAHVVMACGCVAGRHDDSISQIEAHHHGVNPWPIRSKLLTAARERARSQRDAHRPVEAAVSDSQPSGAEGRPK